MAISNQLQSYSQYTDSELIQIPGPNGTTIGYVYDDETRTFYTRETSLLFSGRHGSTHISSDPIPAASCNSPGLMSATDKCKLDSITGMRVGVLGFQGAGFPDDGGWITEDLILAAGNDYISLERVGNVVRFMVETPSPFTCDCESCQNIYWIQDETEANTIRPPSCSGKLPNASVYGEFKVYVFPESQIVNPANPSAVLSRKGSYPTFVFKRYDDGESTNVAELDMVMKRNTNGTTQVGWAFTPGATGKPEYVVYMGLDDDGNQISFKLDGNDTPGISGALLYKGHVVTKRMGVITGYVSTVVQTNQYTAKFWDVVNAETAGSEFTITNIAQYDLTGNTLQLDSVQDTLLSVGQLVDVWTFKVGENSDGPIYTHYCRERAAQSASSLWTTLAAIQFGDQIETQDPGTEGLIVDDVRTIERDVWGLRGVHDDIQVFDATTEYPVINHTAEVVTTSPAGLSVTEDESTDADFELPAELWYRPSLRNAYLEIHVARPTEAASEVRYPPFDVLLRAPIDRVDSVYGRVASVSSFPTGVHDGLSYLVINGADWRDVPARGKIMVIYSETSTTDYGVVYSYSKKLVSIATGPWGVVLVTDNDNLPVAGDMVQFLHEDYVTPAVRFQFDYDAAVESSSGVTDVHDLVMQPMVGTLNTAVQYGTLASIPADNYVGSFDDGYAVGRRYWQDGATLTTTTSGISVDPDGFVVYTGVSGESELYNVIKILVDEQKVWLWWNDLLVPPSTAESAELSSPVDISTPYFPITDVVQYGKFGLRLWPGAKVRRFIVRSRPVRFSEYTLGQLEIG